MSAPWAKALASVALGALAFALTTPSLAEGRLDAFRRLRAEGLAAAKAGDQAVVRLGRPVVRQVQAAKLGDVVVADGNAHAGHS